jgi:putative transposase
MCEIVNIQFCHKPCLTVFSHSITQQKLNYSNENPIRAGIVNKAEEYIYNSAANYAGMRSIIEVDLL